MNSQQRLKKTIAHLKGSQEIRTNKDFAEKIGFNYPNLSSAVNGSERYLTSNLFHKISLVFTQFNLDWLLTGEGEMINDSDEITSQPKASQGSQKVLRDLQKKQVPYYPDIAVTNSDVHFYDQIMSGQANTQMMYDPNLDGSDFVLPNFGESNYPHIRSGDLVGYKKLTVNSFESLNLDRMYMVVTVNGQRMNKKLQYCKEDESKLWAISVNSKTYKPFKILKKDITEIFEIVGVSRRFGL